VTKKTDFSMVPTTPEQVREELLRQSGVTVVLQECSPEGWVTDLDHELGVPAIVASTTGEVW
jgi:hypothetical protein